MVNNKIGANKMRAIIITSVVLTACGSEKSETKFESPQPAIQQTQQWGSLMLDNAAALPQCNAERKGWLAYLKDSAQFQACDGSAWATVDIKGKDGANGKDGIAGKDGANGTNGTNGTNGIDNKIVSVKYCSTIFNQFGLALILNTRFTETAAGDVTATCSVISSQSSVSKAESWAAGSNGALNASCVVHTDVDFTADFGSFSFNRTGVIYTPGVNATENQKIAVVFDQDECVVSDEQ
jgi:hypothetical protein